MQLLSGVDLEAFACGEPEIDVEILRQHTEYEGSGGWGPSHPAVKLFWEAFATLSQQERGQFLRFVWGRRRLPHKDAWKQKFRLKRGQDGRLPTASTCFFKLDWPASYADLQTALRMLRIAIYEGLGAFAIV